MPERRALVLVAVVLVIVTFVCFSGVLGHQFISYDDLGYVTQNEMVSRGITLRGLRWAFTSTEQSNWHPLTWVSHMLDCQLFGLRAGAHKAVSVVIHSANAVLLLVVLWRMTGSVWRSVLVAALF